MKSIPLSCAAFLIVNISALSAANWPAWRGPEGSGVSPDKNLPTKWSPTENVAWRVDLPGPGNSSPIIWGDRVFVTQAVDDRRTLISFDRATGRKLWQSGVTYTEREQTQRANPYCAATPATDGERIVASFGSAGLYCYDFEGKELWHRDFGKMSHGFGNASSPILHGDLCIFPFGPDEKARLIAVNKKTGVTAWESLPPKVDPSEQPQRGGGAAGGGGGGGGGRGPGNFGVGTTLAPQILAQADKDGNKTLTKAELTGIADLWFEKLDVAKAGKLSQEEFAARFYDALPPQERTGGGADAQNPPARRGPSRTTAPAVFTAADTNKDGSLGREEFKDVLGKWYADWDKENSNALDEEKLRAGLNGVLPRTGGGPGGGGGGGGRGPGGGGGGGGGSWSTPIVVKAGDREELIMTFPSRVVAYDPKSGKELWISKGVGGTIYTTPVSGEGMLVASSSGPGGATAVALKPGGTGEIPESDRLWRLERTKSAIGSGVIHKGHLYTISQDGIASCLNLKDGKTVWEERLRGPGSRSSSWSSLLLAGDKIYAPNQAGDVFVVRASPTFELLATNSVDEPTNASLAAANGAVFLRTDKALWCLQNP